MKKKLLSIVAGVVLILILGGIAWINKESRFQSPFERDYVLTSVSEIVEGNDGKTYAIDQGKKALLVLNAQGELERKIDGGTEKDDFFYASRICADDLGNIYVADMIYGEVGNRIQKERIICIGEKTTEIIWEVDYTQDENPPLQYGDILELQEKNGQVYFLQKGEQSLKVYRIALGDSEYKVENIKEIPCEYPISDASYDVEKDGVVITTRLGEVYVMDMLEAEWKKIPSVFEQQIPWDISSVNGQVYYTDLSQNSVIHFDWTKPSELDVVFTGEDVLYKLGVSADGQSLLVTDNVQFIKMSTENYEETVVAEVSVGNYMRVLLFWLAVLFVILLLLFVAVVLVWRGITHAEDKQGVYRIIMVALSSVVVASIASYFCITTLMNNQSEAETEHMQVFAESLMQSLDIEALQELDSIEDYDGKAYWKVKEPLDALINNGYDRGVYYYYVIYNTDGENINCLLDYEDTTVCGHPIYPYGDNEYTQVLTTGEEYTISEISSYGSWMFSLLPIMDKDGNVIAELEVGANLDRLVQERQKLLKENIITVFCSCAVVVMLILEALFAMSFFENRRKQKKEKWDITQQMPLRIMVFLVYMTDSMQDAFIAILCSRLYVDNLPLSKELAIALPMSLQLLMAAIFSVFGGKFAVKFGTKRTMQLGLISQMAGFLLCALVPGYMGILVGKIAIGIGLGIVYVTSNTMASMGGNDDYVASGFADVSAGVLSGVTIGVGLGSLILSFGDYKVVYIIGAVFMLLGLLLTFSARNIRLAEQQQKTGKISIARFMKEKRVISFFILMLVPFMMALSYREYFFPLYVEPYGIDEVQIGRIYLICGLFVLYIGPSLSKALLRILGAKKSIILASLCMAASMGMFVSFPGIVSVMIGMFLLSMVISFAYTCQYTYFEQLPECAAVGEENAMGIYSMFENVGQTLGPVIYGAALLMGNRQGIFVLFAAMCVLVFVFLMINKSGRKEQ